MTASRGFKVMLLAFVILQSDVIVRVSVISTVTVLASSLTSCVTVDTATSGGVLVYNSCNKARTKTTATASSDHRHRHARAHGQRDGRVGVTHDMF